MKKRLLSAALALAMVLTMLPLSALPVSAATAAGTATTVSMTAPTYGTDWKVGSQNSGTLNDNATSYSVVYHTATSKDSYGNLYNSDGWYYLNTQAKEIYLVTSGVVNTTGEWRDGTTATWWLDLDKATQHGMTTFKLIASDTITGFTSGSSGIMWDNVSNLNIDLNGNTLTWSVTDVNRLTSVTLTSSKKDTNGDIVPGAFTTDITVGKSGASGTGKSMNLTLTNITSSDGITYYHSGSSTVTLNNSTVKNIKMTSVPAQNNGTVSGARVVLNDSKVTDTTAGSSAIEIKQTTGSGSQITSNTDARRTDGTVNINGTGSQVSGPISVTGKGSFVNVIDGTTANITVDGWGSGVNVSSMGNTGTVNMHGETFSADELKNTGAMHYFNLTGNGTVAKLDNGDNKMATAKGYDVINIGGNGTVTDLSLRSAQVKVNGGHIGTVSNLYRGSMEVEGAEGKRSSVGTIQLGTTEYEDGVTLTTKGTNVTLGDITRNTTPNTSTNPITISLAGGNNTYGKVPPVSDTHSSVTVLGGTFKGKDNQPSAQWLTKVPYVVITSADANGNYTYVSSLKEAAQLQQKLIADGSANTVVHRSTNTDWGGGVELYVGDLMALRYYGTAGEQFIMPDSLVGSEKIVTWYLENGKDSDNVDAGQPILLPKVTSGGGIGKDTLVHYNAMATSVTLTEITDITVTSHPGVRAELSATGIKLTGTVPVDASGELLMDVVVSTNATNKTSTLQVSYSTLTGKALFVAPTNDPNGLSVISGGSVLRLPGGKEYTLSASLTKQDDSLDTVKTAAKVSATRVQVPGYTSTQNTALAGVITGTGAEATVTGSPAFMASLNSLASQLNGQVSSLLTTARNEMWKAKNNVTSNPTAGQASGLGLTKLWILPVVDVQVSNYSRAGTYGTMTFNLVPSYMLIAGGSTAPDKTIAWQTGKMAKVSTSGNYYLVRDVTALPALSGTMGKVSVKFNVESTFNLGSATTAYARQDSTYVYSVGITSANSMKLLSFDVTHTGRSNGMGTFTVDEKAPLVSLTRTISDNNPKTVTSYYETLQAAVDDTKPAALKDNGNDYYSNDVIDVKGTYGGSTAITLSGKSREFTINTAATVKEVTVTNASGYLLTNTGTSTKTYTVKLTQDTKPVPTTATIAVASAANGTARVNVTTAAQGSTVSGTYTANSGYRAGTFTATAATPNGNVPVSVSVGTNGTFSFTVPSNATSVTVYPSFVLASTLPFTDVATTAWYYEGVRYCYNTIKGSNRLMQGFNNNSTIFGPNSAFTRAEMVTILWNMKGRPNPGYNYHPYSDVPTSHWAYSAITWASNYGYAEGYPGGAFYPNQSVTREEMVVFLWRAVGKPAGYSTLSLNGYTDGYNVHDWAQTAMKWALAYGILSGQNSVSLGGTIAPRAVAYRSQVAVTVMNFDKLKQF